MNLVETLNTHNAATVTFKKLDGTTRVMDCTWGPDSWHNNNHAVVWDLDNKDYRSIRNESILKVTPK